MRSKLVFLVTLLLAGWMNFSFGQIINPVKWKQFTIENKDGSKTLELIGTIEKGWHIYSTTPSDEIFYTRIFLNDSISEYEKIGDIDIKGVLIKGFDEVFQAELEYFEDEIIIRQPIRVLDSQKPFRIIIGVQYQACDDSRCLQPNLEEFFFDFNGYKKSSTSNNTPLQNANDDRIKIQNLDLEKPLGESCVEKQEVKDKSHLEIFFLGFLGGLLALLTPCVFPMIPLTVSYFTKKKSDNKKGMGKAFLYGFFILLIYVLLSLPFHFLENVEPEILNYISTNIWLNLFFFIIFIVFALSFFGLFEITLPSGLANKIDNYSRFGGFLGIFFMALTLAIVSFSCTGPILGSLLVGAISSNSGAIQLTYGMSGFGLALALPFVVFAIFPKLMKSLPKSGGWMQTTKVVLGFIELALAFKFLSIADLVGHWGILKREILLVIWIVIFLLIFLYLFRIFPFKKKSYDVITTLQRVFGLFFFGVSLYLFLGLFKIIPLSFASGLLPPQYYSVFKTESDCPLGLNCFKNYEEGVNYAKEMNKPILLDFTGWGCVNCRKMEETVWSESEIFKILDNEYVIISLYVDDYQKKLPKEKQFEYLKPNGSLKKIVSVGDLWSTFQTVNFNSNSQPLYVLLTPNEELIVHPVGYASKEEFKDYLECGLTNFIISQDKKENKPTKFDNLPSDLDAINPFDFGE